MTLVPINWKPDRRELRKFAVWLFVFCGLAAVVLYFVKGQPRAAVVTVAFGALTALLGVGTRKGALPIYWFWMAISYCLSVVIGPIVFAFVFYLVLTPLALVMRAIGRDRLSLVRRPVDTYWRDVPPKSGDAESYQRQF